MKKLIYSLLAAVCLLGNSSCGQKEHYDVANPTISVIPQPQEVVGSKNQFHLTSGTVFGVDLENKQLVGIAQYMNGKIASATGFQLPITKKGNIKLQLSDDESLGKEGYTLEVKRGEILVQGHQPAGVFYGVQTLLQLFPAEILSQQPMDNEHEWAAPCVKIKDVPKFPWRGFMLDVSRHWFTKDEVKRMIDELATYKMNVFHWHLTDDQGWRIQIKSLPKLTEVGAWRAQRVGNWWQREPQDSDEKATYGGFYTQEDIQEVLDYAAARFVRVIPEVDVPGHSLAALVSYPELACMHAPKTVNVGNKFYGEDENTLCVGNEKTFEFMDKVLTEVAALFPDEYIHIGGDECFKGFWHKCPKCQALMRKEGLKNEEELQSYFIRRMESILKSKGKKLIGWDEILEGGLAPEATVMSWRGMEGGIKSAKSGHHVIMTPTQHCYLDLYQGEKTVEPATYSICRLSDCYNFNPVPDSVPAEMVLGSQGNLWSEAVPTFRHAEYMAWPRTWALAEVLWTGPEKSDWNQFYPRVEQHFERADQAGINYARSMYNAIVTPKYTEDKVLEVELSCELADSDIYYTFDNTNPDQFSPKYEKPLRIPRGASNLRVNTFRNGKMSGQLISLPIAELEKRAEQAQ